MSISTHPDIATRLDVLCAKYDDAELADAWRAMIADARVVYGDATRWVHGYWEPHTPRPLFHAQPWAPRRRQRKACRR